HLFARLRVGYVALHGQNVDAFALELVAPCPGLFFVAIVGRNLVPHLREPMDDRGTDAAGAPRNQCYARAHDRSSRVMVRPSYACLRAGGRLRGRCRDLLRSDACLCAARGPAAQRCGIEVSRCDAQHGLDIVRIGNGLAEKAQCTCQRCRRIWRGVESSRSQPRTTSVMPWNASSTTHASW